MTKLNSVQEKTRTKLNQAHNNSKLPLIPPATIRASARSKFESTKQQQSPYIKSSGNIINNNHDNNETLTSISENQENRMSAMTKHQKSASGTNMTAADEVWSSAESLFWDHMREVENKWSTLKLNDDIWAKLIYFEQNRRLAKAYVSAPVLTVDGSTNGLDGFRIGLSGIDNTYRQLESISCLRSIGLGLKLKIDDEGNILIKKLQPAAQSQTNCCSIWIRSWPNSQPASDGSAEIKLRQLSNSDLPFKLFDMKRFRSQLEKKSLAAYREFQPNGSRLEQHPEAEMGDDGDIDWRQCVSIVSFVWQERGAGLQAGNLPTCDLLEDPCWLMIINIIAIDMLKSFNCDRRRKLLASRQVQTMSSGRFESNGNISNPKRTSAAATGPVLKSSSSSAAILGPYTSAAAGGNVGGRKYQAPPGVDRREGSMKSSALNLSGDHYSPSGTDGAHNYASGGNLIGSKRYQSSLQLSSNGNNTIYTTFNTKQLSQQRKFPLTAGDNLSTSDYNSGSRSTRSSGQNYWRKPAFYQFDSLMNTSRIQANQMRLYNQQKQFSLLSRRNLINENLAPNNNFSLSSHDLSTKQRRVQQSMENENNNSSNENFPFDSSRKFLNARSMQTAFKMNYDFNTESEGEEFFGEDDSNDSGNSNQILHANQASNSSNRRALVKNHLDTSRSAKFNDRYAPKEGHLEAAGNCCDLTEKLKINHNECSAMQGLYLHGDKEPPKAGDELKLKSKLNLKERSSESNSRPASEEAKQMIAKSSIASGSASSFSSSGCGVDSNDYFLSHNSSSSMSTSSSAPFNQLAPSGGSGELFQQVAKQVAAPASSPSVGGQPATSSGNKMSSNSNSSGIAANCSYNSSSNISSSATSDDYTSDAGNKMKPAKLATDQEAGGVQSSGRFSGALNGKTKRAFNIKTIEDLPGGGEKFPYQHEKDCCPEVYNPTRPADCDCPSFELGQEDVVDNCQECCCDCFKENEQVKSRKLRSTAQTNRCKAQATTYNDCLLEVEDEDSIYSRLPHPTSGSRLPTTGASGNIVNNNNNLENNHNVGKGRKKYAKDGKALKREHLNLVPGGNGRLSKSLFQNSYHLHAHASDNEAADTFNYRNRSHTELASSNDSKSRNGKLTLDCDGQQVTRKPAGKESSWLDRRKYGRVLSRFIFMSSALDNNNEKSTQLLGARKSSTLDKNDKFRLTRSNLDLS